METKRPALLVGLVLLALLLASCQGYTVSGGSSQSQMGASGGVETVRARSANGSTEQDIEGLDDVAGEVLEADVTLTVGKGSYKIELLGTDGEVTLMLEARDGETVSGHGQMAVDLFGEAGYRVTATEAKDVEYTIVYAFP